MEFAPLFYLCLSTANGEIICWINTILSASQMYIAKAGAHLFESLLFWMLSTIVLIGSHD